MLGLGLCVFASTAIAQPPASPARPTSSVPTCFDDDLLGRGERRAEDQDPRTICRRGPLEMIELYVIASLGGLSLGAASGEALELSEDESGWLAFGGLAALDLGVFLVDDAANGLPPGVPTAMGTGLMLGIASGFTTWLAFGNELFEPGQVLLAGTEGLALGAAGLAFGLAARPTIGQSALVRSGGWWGAVMAAFYTKLIGADDLEDVSKTIFIGMHAGALGFAVLAGQLRPSRLQALWVDLGAVVGMAALGLVGAAFEDDDITALFAMVGMGGGMAVGFLLGDRSELPPDFDASVQVGADRASFSVRGAF